MKLFTRNFYFAMTFITGLLLSSDAFAIKHVIQVAGVLFSPNTFTGIIVGDTVRWEWQDGTHTTTSTSVPTNAATWDAPLNSNNTSFEYRVLVAGNYTFKCTFHESMGMTGSFSAVEISTGIAQAALPAKTVNFYPNPVGNDLKISLTSNEPLPGMLRIYDVGGQVVMQIPFSVREGENLFDLPVAALTKGMYICELTTGDHRIAMRTLNKE